MPTPTTNINIRCSSGCYATSLGEAILPIFIYIDLWFFLMPHEYFTLYFVDVFCLHWLPRRSCNQFCRAAQFANQIRVPVLDDLEPPRLFELRSSNYMYNVNRHEHVNIVWYFKQLTIIFVLLLWLYFRWKKTLWSTVNQQLIFDWTQLLYYHMTGPIRRDVLSLENSGETASFSLGSVDDVHVDDDVIQR